MLYHRALLGIWYYQLFYAHFPFMMYTYPMEDKSTNISVLIKNWFIVFITPESYSEILEKYIDISSEQFDLMAAITDLNASDEKRNKAVELGIFPEEAFKPEFTGKNAQIQSMISSQTKKGAYTRLFLEKFFDDRFKEKLAEEHFDMSILEHKDFDLIQKYLNVIEKSWTGDSWYFLCITRKKSHANNPFTAYEPFGQGEYSKLLIGWDDFLLHNKGKKKMSPDLLQKRGLECCLKLVEGYQDLRAELKKTDRYNSFDLDDQKKVQNAAGAIGKLTETVINCLQTSNEYKPFHLSSIVKKERSNNKELLSDYIKRDCSFEIKRFKEKMILQKKTYDELFDDVYTKYQIDLINELCAFIAYNSKPEKELVTVRDKIAYLSKNKIEEQIYDSTKKKRWTEIYNSYVCQYPESYETSMKKMRAIEAGYEANDKKEFEDDNFIHPNNSNFDSGLYSDDNIKNEEFFEHKTAQYLKKRICEAFKNVDSSNNPYSKCFKCKNHEFCDYLFPWIEQSVKDGKQIRLNCGDPDISSNHRGYMANSICDATRKKMDEKIAELIRKDNPKIVLPSRLNIKETKTLLQDFNEITDEDLEKRFNVPEVLIDYVKLLFLLETLRNTTKSGHPWEKFYGEYSKIVYNSAPGTRDEQMEKFINNMKEIYNDFKKTKGGLLCR